MISRVLVAIDGSDTSLLAAKYATFMATNLGCKVTLIHVVEYPPMPFTLAGVSEQEIHRFKNSLRESARAILRLGQKPLAEAGVTAEIELKEGRPADVICQVAQEGKFDLIIIGSRGLGMVGRVLLGSVSQEVIRAAPCPVLVIRN